MRPAAGASSAAASAIFSRRKTVTAPRSRRIHPCAAQIRSCLFVLSRDLPMIWLISRCVIVTFRIEACPSASAVIEARPFASRWANPGMPHLAPARWSGAGASKNLDDLHRQIGLTAEICNEVSTLDHHELAIRHRRGIGGARMAIEQSDFPEDLILMNDVEHGVTAIADGTLIFTDPARTPISPVPGSPLRR